MLGAAESCGCPVLEIRVRIQQYTAAEADVSAASVAGVGGARKYGEGDET